jgi:hypothetical protein
LFSQVARSSTSSSHSASSAFISVQHNGRDLVIRLAPKKQSAVKNEMSSTESPPQRNLRGNRLSRVPGRIGDMLAWWCR